MSARWAALAALPALALAQPCQRSFPGATYDFSSLMGNDYTWSDDRSMTETGWRYTFSFCGPVSTLPAPCQGVVPPPDPNYGYAPAYQWNNGNTLTNLSSKVCLPVSQVIPNPPAPGSRWPYSLSLIDASDPSYGVMLQYNAVPQSQDPAYFTCPTDSSGNYVGRSLALVMRCGYEPFPAPNTFNTPTDTFITEVDVCQYEAYSWSQAGCPKECPISGGKLCSNKGVCAYDKQISASRCFCDDGYLSADCSAPADPFPSAAVTGALFGGLILAAAAMLGTAFFLSRRAKPTSAVDGFYGQVAG